MKKSTEQKAKTKKDFGREKIHILFEDENICVINKPTGLLSVPYPGSRAKTCESLLEEIYRKRGTLTSKHKPLTVHRLDRDTSGVMVFALNERTQKIIMETWHTMVTSRLYRAVAENPKQPVLFLPDSGLIDDELAYNSHNVGFVPKEGDRPRHHGEKDSIYERNITGHGENRAFKTVEARTHFKVIERGKTHTLFELSLDKDKKNQIRAHLASKGYPLAGDENYRARTDYFGRLCLHARTLEFIHPYTKEQLHFEVPEPDSWLEYVKNGDPNPKTPVWIKEMHSSFNAKAESFHNKNNFSTISGEKRITKKEKSHMDYIQLGKRNRKK